jgi:hypothetical protein
MEMAMVKLVECMQAVVVRPLRKWLGSVLARRMGCLVSQVPQPRLVLRKLSGSLVEVEEWLGFRGGSEVGVRGACARSDQAHVLLDQDLRRRGMRRPVESHQVATK